MKKALVSLMVLGFMATAANASVVVGQVDEFKLMSKSYLTQSPNINASQVRLLEENLTKDSVRLAVGDPHFGTGLLPAKQWQYRFTVINGADRVQDCSYLIEFDKEYVESIKTLQPECISILEVKKPKLPPMPSPEKVAERIEKMSEKFSVRGVERAEAQFAFNKSSVKDITNSVDWNRLAEEIKRDKPQRIFLSAYTDSKGTFIYNLELSSKRADSVAQELIKRGVDASLIEINNIGKTSTFSERKVVVSW